LLAGLRTPPHAYLNPTSIFPDLNADLLAADLRLVERGTQRGNLGEPSSAGDALDEVEHAIIERVEREKRLVHGLYLDQLQTYAERFANLDFESRFGVIRQAAPQAVADFRAEAGQGRDELHRLRRRIVDTERDRDAFRKRHKIQRSARASTPGKQLLKVGILVALLVIEVAANGAFLAKGSEQGLIGGAVEAVSFASLNVLGSFLLGLSVVRLIGHRRFTLKILGLLGLAFYVVAALALNLALAHYREVSGALTTGAGVEVVQRLQTAPYALSDVASWILFGIGMTFSLIAMADGVLFRDPYIGYAAVDKAWQSAQDEYSARKAALIDNLRDIRDDASEAMNEAARDLSLKRGEFDSIQQAKQRLNAAFRSFQDQLERTAQALLSIYREANRRARSDPPARFEKPITLDRFPIVSDENPETRREELRKSIADSQALLAKEVRSIHEEFEAAAATYRQIDDMIPDPPYVAPAKT
jgi:hypothetical protein